MAAAVGLRVIRGPDWNQDDDDGGEGHVGTVVEVGDHGNVNVTWDGGQVTMCREGQHHDLRVIDNATVGE
jgi:E3 ubiquitin-protein ligase mind-bomb